MGSLVVDVSSVVVGSTRSWMTKGVVGDREFSSGILAKLQGKVLPLGGKEKRVEWRCNR